MSLIKSIYKTLALTTKAVNVQSTKIDRSEKEKKMTKIL